MIKMKSFFGSIAAVFAVLLLIVSCEETGGGLDLGDNGDTGDYSITIKDGIKNGIITATRLKASKGQTVLISAQPGDPSAWEGSGPAPAAQVISSVFNTESPDTVPEAEQTDLYPWYLGKLSVTYGEKNTGVTYTKTATNEWKFTMPAGNVTINGEFTQTSVDSDELSVLLVTQGAVTPELSTGKYEYRADIPHIFPVPVVPATEEVDSDDTSSSTDTSILASTTEYAEEPVSALTFSIVALPEDPNATVTITPPGGGGVGSSEPETTESDEEPEYELVEGETTYTIKVTSSKGSTKSYKLIVSYEPDLTLSSIKLTSTTAPSWSQELPVVDTVDTQDVVVPYSPIKFEGTANATGDSAPSVTTSGTNLPNNTLSLSNDTPTGVKIVVTKEVTKKIYKKEYVINIVKSTDPNFPTVTEAGGGGVSIIKEGAKYYEVHTFTSNGKLAFTNTGKESVQADILVVAGGGGGGYSTDGDWAGGGGAGGLIHKTSYTLPLSGGSVSVTVGAGGSGGNYYSPNWRGYQGSNSSVGGSSLTAIGGGYGGAGHRQNQSENNGGSGGSGGGAGAGWSNKSGTPGSSSGTNIGYSGGYGGTTGGDDAGGGGGGAGGAGRSASGGTPGSGGAGYATTITGKSYTYSAGGKGGGKNYSTSGDGGYYYGDGGNGGATPWNNGGSGRQGIVIIRFEIPATATP
ncbi:MAG: hypothetical protein LBB22_05195 [Treponema sp.]|jgi:hypothetical protein|nr:hypothetical protein [Treponema sp.]